MILQVMQLRLLTELHLEFQLQPTYAKSGGNWTILELLASVGIKSLLERWHQLTL